MLHSNVLFNAFILNHTDGLNSERRIAVDYLVKRDEIQLLLDCRHASDDAIQDCGLESCLNLIHSRMHLKNQRIVMLDACKLLI